MEALKTMKISSTDVTAGMAVLIDGEMKTVCQNNIGKSSFSGLTIYGHTFREGIDLVLFPVWRSGAFAGHHAIP